MEKAGEKAASKFLDALVKSVQSLCHGYLEFQNGIEIVGFINLSVDRENSVDCVLKERVCKTAENATSFISNSYHAKPVPEEASSGTSQPGNKNASTVHSPSSNRLSSETRDSDFPHPSRGSLKRRTPEDHSAESCRKKTSSHLGSRHHPSSENVHSSSSQSVESSETELAQSTGRGSKSPDDMDPVKLTGSGIVLEPVDDQGCAGEESSDFDVTFIKEEFVEEDTSAFELESSAGQHLAGDQFRRGQNSNVSFLPVPTVSSVDPASGFKVEPVDHQDAQGSSLLQPHPGSSTMRGLSRSQADADYEGQGLSTSPINSLHINPGHLANTVPHPHSNLGVKREILNLVRQPSVASVMASDKEMAAQSKILLCEYCDASFTSSGGLSLHKATVHLQRRFVCNVCGKVLKRKATLIHHMQSHRMGALT